MILGLLIRDLEWLLTTNKSAYCMDWFSEKKNLEPRSYLKVCQTRDSIPESARERERESDKTKTYPSDFRIASCSATEEICPWILTGVIAAVAHTIQGGATSQPFL